MNQNRYHSAKAGRESGGFAALPHMVIRSEGFTKLSAHAVKLLIDLLAQHRGNNNGDLCAAWKIMKPRGWKSRDTLGRAIVELLTADFIMKSRQGGRHRATLYAVTFFKVDECGRKLDIQPTLTPLGTWKRHEPVRPLRPINTTGVSIAQLPTPGAKIKIKHARRVNSTSTDTTGGSNNSNFTPIDTTGVSVRPISENELTRRACTFLEVPSPSCPPSVASGSNVELAVRQQVDSDPEPWEATL